MRPEAQPSIVTIHGEAVSFEDYRNEFDWDGSWRDLYVHDVTISDWKVLLDFLKGLHCDLYFFVDGSKVDVPSDVTAMFEQPRSADSLMEVRLSSAVTLNCRFFREDEIEFDFDPRGIIDDATLISVLGFMSNIGRALNRRVELTPENAPGRTIFSFGVADGLQYHAPR